MIFLQFNPNNNPDLYGKAYLKNKKKTSIPLK